MNKKISLLDCTLRDGAYIVDSKFGKPAIRGIISRMQDANVDIIECGWLKNNKYEEGTTFYHIPSDLEQYLTNKNEKMQYVAMIDWDRYDLSTLPEYDGKSIDAIRVVFPHGKCREGIALAKIIREKGYSVYFQAANTLAYTEPDLQELADEINRVKPVAISVVDTFGAMYPEDLERIVRSLDAKLDKDIKIGFHSHNNQQLSFALSMHFIEMFKDSERSIIVDASLCGMGRGAGNTTTELLVSYLNKKCNGNYDLNIIMDAIDMYMSEFLKNFTWGYSTPYFISGLYCAHVNNIAYLQRNHHANAMEIKNVIDALPSAKRKVYDYDLLEQTYLDYESKVVNDTDALTLLKEKLKGKPVLLIFPGKSTTQNKDKIISYINEKSPVIIGINAINKAYNFDFLFFSNIMRYDYANEVYPKTFFATKRIITSNVKIENLENEYIVNFNMLVKRGWDHFDNSGMMCLRLLNLLRVKNVALAGFDGFNEEYSESYADTSLPPISPGKEWSELNAEISDMLRDFKATTANDMILEFITPSKYDIDEVSNL